MLLRSESSFAPRFITTAYVGYRLSLLTGKAADLVRPAIERAAEWLRSAEFEGDGWGYSITAGTDADSTALAILFLSAMQVPLGARAYEKLISFQQNDGGIATFRAPDGFGAWTISHPEVTATALAALLPFLGRHDSRIIGGIEYLLRNRSKCALWNSYWWDSELYSTEVTLRLLRTAAVFVDEGEIQSALRTVIPRNSFERALMTLCGGPADPASGQLDDGSWPSAPVLRVTKHDCADPWNVPDAGQKFADQNRVFTTATVVLALNTFQSL